MSKPWGLQGGPGPDVIRSLVLEEGLGATAIGERFGAARQTVEHWMRQAGLETTASPRMNHKRFLPWELTTADNFDCIANALRTMSRVEQGVPASGLTRANRNQMVALQAHLERYNRVVAYSREEAQRTGVGFTLVPRDPKVDDPELPVRRPA